MAKRTKKEQILSVAEALLEKRPEGCRYTELCAAVHRETLLNEHTIKGYIYDAQNRSKLIEKPSYGLYVHVKHGDLDVRRDQETREPVVAREKDFYAGFADLIVNMEEATRAITLGGAKFGVKWGTPDVIGVKETTQADIIQMQSEIVSAEIKTNTDQLVTAFGQACAYCLFSHKSYLVVPHSSGDDQIQRLDSLCQVFGIGLVLFNSKDVADPGFMVRLRARRQSPNYFYMNRYLKLVAEELFGRA